MFNKLVICQQCGKKHKRKKARDVAIYVCSSYDNHGASFCFRNKVDESYIVQLLKMRFKEEAIEEIIPLILSIEVDNSNVKINIKNDNPIIENKYFAQF